VRDAKARRHHKVAVVDLATDPSPSRSGSGHRATADDGIARSVAHVLALWAFAVAQPVYDILRQNGEFFIAHRTRPLDLVLFALTISLALPLAVCLPWLACRALSRRAGRAALVGLMGLLTAMLASQLMAHQLTLPTTVHFAVAAVVGSLVARAYATHGGVRQFMTMLSVAAAIFPAIFLLHPSMSMFVRPDDRDAAAAAVIDRDVPPIVFLIFDQFPLTSLLDTHGRIDRDRYPGFAGLADRATWYRNATTVAEFTGWAVPPILSGVRPTPRKMPTSHSYPDNLFTWLGARYRYEVQEPITQLCPDRLCVARRDPVAARMLGMTLDSSVVYLSLALPAGLRTLLPPLTENWKNFIHDQRWQRRWVHERDDDRRAVPLRFIDAISRDDPQPTIYFAHVLLPHEPYVYLRSGQQFTEDSRMIGLSPKGRWTADPWPVAQAYHRHLTQVEYVDSLVARLVARLTSEGLFDRSLIVVTSDHGVSFRPGAPFKTLEAANAVDLMSVPLLVKAPGQQQGVVDDSNVESIDVMPTIASLLGVPLTWKPDGVAAGSVKVDPGAKTIQYGGVRLRATHDVATLARAREAAVARKAALFGESPGWRAPVASHQSLIGQRVDTWGTEPGDWQAVVEQSSALQAVDPQGPTVPGLLRGWVRDAAGAPADADLAIALNGVVTAVTRTYGQADGARGTWSSMIDPLKLTRGRNDVRIYVLGPEGTRPHLAYSSRARPDRVNLASRGAEDFWAVTQSGFYGREGLPIPHRWTMGEAALVVPLEPDHLPKSLRIGITAIRASGVPLTLTLNDCTLYSGTIAEAPWYKTFSLKPCPPSTLAASHARVVIKTEAWTSPDDQRRVGVAVETVNLFERDWPIAGDDALEDRARIRALANAQAYEAGKPLPIEVTNTGDSTWLSASDASAAGAPVQLAIRWQHKRQGRVLEQRLNLPHALYPTDRVVIEAPLVPPAELRDAGRWTVTIAPVEQDGTAVPMESVFAIDVSEPRQPGR